MGSSLSGKADPADKARMRPFDTAFALFLAAILLVELFEESDRERSREPIRLERFQLAAAMQIAAVVILGPWRGALVAAAGAVAGSLVHGARLRPVAFDARDPSTYRHSLRVAGYVDDLARGLRLPFSEIDRLRWAGRLHDLGKVAVDASLLRKRGGLDGAEWASMRRHPRLSARLLQRFEFVAAQAQAVELHHERMDGSGYYGIGGADLPLASHFLIVADSFDAMTTDRPYRPGLTHEAALAEIERNAGTQFHPTVAKAFVAVQRGTDPMAVLSAQEVEQIRGAAAPYRIGLAGPAELKERPELLILGGIVLALTGLGFAEGWLAACGGGVAGAGLMLSALVRLRAERAAAAFHRALQSGGNPDQGFARLAD